MTETIISLASHALSRVKEYYRFHKSVEVNVDLHYALLLGEYKENTIKIYAFYFPPPDLATPMSMTVDAIQSSLIKVSTRFKGSVLLSLLGVCYFTASPHNLPLKGDQETISNILKLAPKIPFVVLKVHFSKLENLLNASSFDIIETHNIINPKVEVQPITLSKERMAIIHSLREFSNIHCSKMNNPFNMLVCYESLPIEAYEFHYYKSHNPVLKAKLDTIKKKERLGILAQYFWSIKLERLQEILKVEKGEIEKICSQFADFELVQKGLLSKDEYLIIKDPQLEKIAKDLFTHKIKHGKFPSQTDLFIHYELSPDQIKDVCRYISAEINFDINKLLKFIGYNISLLEEHEKASKSVIKQDNIDMADLIVNKKMDVSKAKRILAYISAVASADLSRVPEKLKDDSRKAIEDVARLLIQHIKEKYGIENDHQIAKELSINLLKYLRTANLGILTGKLAAVYALENLYKTNLTVTLQESIVRLQSFIVPTEGGMASQSSIVEEKALDQFCPYCGALLPSTETNLYICPFCGSSLPVCPICSDNVSGDDRVSCPICGAQYHEECAKSWIALHSECKVCKTRTTLTNFEALWKKDFHTIMERVSTIRELGVEGVIKQIFELAHPSGKVVKADLIRELSLLPQTLEKIVQILKDSSLLIEEIEHGNVIYYIPSAWEYLEENEESGREE